MIDNVLIENFKNITLPFMSNLLFKINYEGEGTQDKEDFERDFNEILDLALAGLKYKAQLSQEGATSDMISKFIDGLEEIFADLRERHVDDSVCGLCEYDGAYIGQSGDWCNECPGFNRDDCFKLSDEVRNKWTEEIIKALPSVQPEPHEGHWIWVAGELMCSECRTIYSDLYPDYDNAVACPHCGAKMKGAEHEND